MPSKLHGKYGLNDKESKLPSKADTGQLYENEKPDLSKAAKQAISDSYLHMEELSEMAKYLAKTIKIKEDEEQDK